MTFVRSFAPIPTFPPEKGGAPSPHQQGKERDDFPRQPGK